MPETSVGAPPPSAVDSNEAAVARAVNSLNPDLLDDDIDVGPEAAVEVDEEAMRRQEAAEPTEEIQAERQGDKKRESQRVSVSGALPDLVRLLGTGKFSKEEISANLGQMAEKFGLDNEKWMELTSFVESVSGAENSPFAENFPQDKKLEIICALAEVVVEENGVDGQVSAMLAGKIEYYSDPSAMDKSVNLLEAGDVACGWTVDSEGNKRLIVFDSFFECPIEAQRHMIKHELSHGLNMYGEIYSKEQKKQVRAHFEGKEVQLDGVMQRVVSIIENAKDNKAGQSERVYKFLIAIEKLEASGENDETYKKAKAAAGEAGLTFESYLAMVKADAAEEIMAEQTAAYLESDGSYVDFIRSSLENRSPELYKFLGVDTDESKQELDTAINQLQEAKTQEEKDAILTGMQGKWPKIYDYMREKHDFFKNINDTVKKPDFKEKVIANMQAGGQEEQEYFDGVDDGQKREKEGGGEQKQGESLLSIAKELAEAFSKEVAVVPGTVK